MIDFEHPRQPRRPLSRLAVMLALAMWMIAGVLFFAGWTIGLAVTDHEADPTVWRCAEYVPGSADCQVLVRR